MGLDGLMSENKLSKPEIDAPVGPAPTELSVVDIVVGDGPEAFGQRIRDEVARLGRLVRAAGIQPK